MKKFLLLLLLLLTSCHSARYIPLPVSHARDSVRVASDHRYDSIFIDRWHTLILRGDTVFKTDSIYVEKLRDIEVHDTLTVTQHDTITVPVPIEPPPRKSLAFSERIRVFGKGCLLGGLVAILLCLILYFCTPTRL